MQVPWPELAGRTGALRPPERTQFDARRGLAADGLYVGLDPWSRYFLALARRHSNENCDPK